MKKIISMLTSFMMMMLVMANIAIPISAVATSEADADTVLKIGSVKANAGETVKVPVSLTKNTKGLASVQLKLKTSGGITVKANSMAGTMKDSNMVCMPNYKDAESFILAWVNANTASLEGTDAEVMSLEFEIPAGTPDGTYPITFADASEYALEGTNAAGVDLNMYGVAGEIVVGEGGEVTTTTTVTTADTTADTTPAVTTTTAVTTPAPTPGDYDTELTIGTVTGKAGETVTLPIALTKNDKGFASVQLKLNTALPTVKDSMAGTMKDSNMVCMPNYTKTDSFILAWVNANTASIEGLDENLMTLQFTIPADAAPGTVYPITFADASDYALEGTNAAGENLKINGVAGAIKVEEEVKPADTQLTIGKVTGKPGETVTLPVALTKNDKGFASVQLKLNTSLPTVKDSMAGTMKDSNMVCMPNYNKEDSFILAWVNADTASIEGLDDNLMTLQYTIPEDAKPGTVYPITFADKSDYALEGTNAAGENLVIEGIDGSITVEEEVGGEPDLILEAEQKKAKPGELVTYAVKVTKNDKGVASLQMKLKTDVLQVEKDSIGGYVKDNNMVCMPNYGQANAYILAWVNADTASMEGTNDEFMTIQFQIPEDATPGTKYPITFAPNSEYALEGTNGAGENLNIKGVDGWIEIEEPEDTTTTTTTTEETTTTTEETTTTTEESTTETSTTEPTTTTVTTTETSTTEPTTTTVTTTETTTTEPTTTTVTTTPTTTTTPEPTETSTTTSETTTVTTTTTPTPTTTTEETTVTTVTTTPTETTTTTAETPAPEADLVLEADKVEVAAGDTVTYKVKVTKNAKGVASLQMKLKTDALQVENESIGGYVKDSNMVCMPNYKQANAFTLAWVNAGTLSMEGTNDEFITIQFTVPADAEEGTIYPITFAPNSEYELAGTNGAGEDLVVEGVAGYIKVKATTTTTTTTEESTTTTVTTTPTTTTTPEPTETSTTTSETTTPTTTTTPEPTETSTTTSATTTPTTTTTPEPTETSTTTSETTTVTTTTTPTPTTTTSETTVTTVTTTPTETTTTTAETPVPDADLVLEADKVEAAPGETVKFPVKVTKNAKGVASLQMKLKTDALQVADGSLAGYVQDSNMVCMPNYKQANAFTLAWVNAGTLSMEGTNDEFIMLTFEIPEDAEDGTIYPITFAPNSEYELAGTNGDGLDLVIEGLDGYIKVVAPTPTTTVTTTTTPVTTTTTPEPTETSTTTSETTTVTTTTTPEPTETSTTTSETTTVTTTTTPEPTETSTTTSESTTETTVTTVTTTPTETTTTTAETPAPDADLVLKIDDIEAEAGETVKLPIKVTKNAKGVASLQMQVKTDALQVNDGSLSGYVQDSNMVCMPNYKQNNKFTLAWVNAGTASMEGLNDEFIVLEFTIPEDAEAGTKYPITFADSSEYELAGTNGNAEDLVIEGINGSITVKGKDTTTETTTTTAEPATSPTTTTTETTVTTSETTNTGDTSGTTTETEESMTTTTNGGDATSETTTTTAVTTTTKAAGGTTATTKTTPGSSAKTTTATTKASTTTSPHTGVAGVAATVAAFITAAGAAIFSRKKND